MLVAAPAGDVAGGLEGAGVGVAEGEVHNGMEVTLSVEAVDGVVLPQFRPVEIGSA